MDRSPREKNSSIRFEAGGSEPVDSGFCETRLNLLAHAQAVELDIGSRCGGHGVCGGDRVLAPRGAALSPLTDAERQHLSSDEIAQGWRLACQCFPESADQNLLLKTSIKATT